MVIRSASERTNTMDRNQCWVCPRLCTRTDSCSKGWVGVTTVIWRKCNRRLHVTARRVKEGKSIPDHLPRNGAGNLIYRSAVFGIVNGCCYCIRALRYLFRERFMASMSTSQASQGSVSNLPRHGQTLNAISINESAAAKHATLAQSSQQLLRALRQPSTPHHVPYAL